MITQEQIDSIKAVLSKVQDTLKLGITAITICVLTYALLKQSVSSTPTEVTVGDVKVCGPDVISNLLTAGKLADPITATLIDGLIANCQRPLPVQSDLTVMDNSTRVVITPPMLSLPEEKVQTVPLIQTVSNPKVSIASVPYTPKVGLE